MSKRSGRIIGIALVVLGALSLAHALGAAWASMERLWPLLVIVGGAAAIREGLRERHMGRLWFGVTATLCGILLAWVTLVTGWAFLGRWWPLVVGFAGLGWLAVWLCDRQERSNAALAVASLVACGVLLARNHLPAAAFAGLIAWWPWLLVVAGVALVVQGLLAWRGHADRD